MHPLKILANVFWDGLNPSVAYLPAMPASPLDLYGTAWCPKTANLKHLLQQHWLEPAVHDVEADPAAAQLVMAQFGGRLLFPALRLANPNGEPEWLLNPKPPELLARLKALGYDV